MRLVDHLADSPLGRVRRRPPGCRSECPRIASGHAERTSRQRDERHDDRELADAQVERRLGDGRADVAVQHGRDQPQHVHRREHDRDRADRRPSPSPAGRRPRGSGTRRRSSTRAARRARSRRPSSARSRAPAGRAPCRRAATSSPVAVRRSTIPASRNSVIEISPWLTICSTAPSKPRSLFGEEAERDQPHLRERRVGDDAADVGRAEGEQRAVDERRSRRARGSDVRQSCVGPGNLRDRDPQEARRRPTFEITPESSRRDLGRRLAVGVGQPAVERPERRLDREGDREAEEEPVVRLVPDLRQVERALLEPEDDDRGEHQQRARHRVDDELDRRAEPARRRPRRRSGRRAGSASPRRTRRRAAGPAPRRRRPPSRSGRAAAPK